MSKNPLPLALKRLSFRAYSQRELENYLVKRNFSERQIKETITQLLEWGYLNDAQLAKDWYRHYTQHKSYGYFYLCHKLRSKGFCETTITSLLANYDREKEYKRVQLLAEKFMANKATKTQPQKLKEKLARHLYRRGFLQENIMKVLTENFSD